MWGDRSWDMVRKAGDEEFIENFGGAIPRETSTRMTEV
jgi:hypothetical protein